MRQSITSGRTQTVSSFRPGEQRWTKKPPIKPWDEQANRRNFRRWHAAMAAGAFSEAWNINDEEAQHWPSAHQLWNGTPLRGRSIDLHALHGLGDFVQMMRFVPRLNQLGCDITLNVRPELMPLLPCFSGSFRTAAETRSTRHCVAVEMMELLYALRVEPAHLPASANYLRLPPSLTTDLRERMNTGSCLPKAGVVWSGSAWDPERWIPVEHLAPLLQLKCCEWWSMQGPESAQEGDGLPLLHFDKAGKGGLLEFAAAIQNLDLLITADTLAAHIAGALGKPVWVLLKKDADWRWLKGRVDSPWYPTMRLFRQAEHGAWTAVLSQVRDAVWSAFHCHTSTI